MGLSREEYWNGFSFPSPGDLPDPGTEPGSPTDSLWSEPPEGGRVHVYIWLSHSAVPLKLSQLCLLIAYIPIQNLKVKIKGQ